MNATPADQEDGPEPQLRQAMLLAQAGQHGPARALAAEIAEEWPDHPAPWELMGRLALAQGDGAAARIALEQAWELAPDRPGLGGLLARCLAMLGLRAPALARAWTAFAALPADPELDSLVTALSEGEAARWPDWLAAAAPADARTCARAFHALGRRQIEAGGWDAAAGWIDLALLADPTLSPAHLDRLALCLRDPNRPSLDVGLGAMVASMRALLDREGDDPATWRMAATLATFWEDRQVPGAALAMSVAGGRWLAADPASPAARDMVSGVYYGRRQLLDSVKVLVEGVTPDSGEWPLEPLYDVLNRLDGLGAAYQRLFPAGIDPSKGPEILALADALDALGLAKDSANLLLLALRAGTSHGDLLPRLGEGLARYYSLDEAAALMCGVTRPPGA
jgi:tetratricopeptide (TPR) repeat protein